MKKKKNFQTNSNLSASKNAIACLFSAFQKLIHVFFQKHEMMGFAASKLKLSGLFKEFGAASVSQKIKKSLLPLLLASFVLSYYPSNAQNLKVFDPKANTQQKPRKTKQKLAVEYYSSGQYEKAVPLFEELYGEKKNSYFYRYLLYCYINLKEYKKAERHIKKANKNNSKKYKELADLGYLQLQVGNIDKADKLFESSIKELPAVRAAVVELANDFRSRRQMEWAEKTYMHGIDLLKGSYGFELELGYLYYFLEQYQKMSDIYLDLLAREPEKISLVQQRIQNAYRRDIDDVVYPYLKDELLKRISDNNPKEIYSELLLWLSIQRKDLKIAMIQAKALDSRDGGDYYRVYDLANIMLNNNEYEESIKGYGFILSRPNADKLIIYHNVLNKLLSAKYQLLISKPNPTQEEIESLANEFETYLNQSGRFKFTQKTVMEYAKLLFNYQNKKENAIEELENLLSNQGLTAVDKAPLKLLLGDLYLLNENPWEATLLYSQVEKDFKNDVYGFESRLKNAKLSFYIGEFDWSKAQLDILKAATDREIANDAMNMSLFISENLDADSSTRALKFYGRAELLHLQNKDSLAILTLDSIFAISLYHKLQDNVWFKQAQIYSNRKEYEKSNEKLLNIIIEFPDGLLADDALWMMAEQFDIKNTDHEIELFRDLESAEDIYRKILTDYPASIYAYEARKRYRSKAKENEKAEIF
jgi:Tfp pilus assembly protein PilF